LQTKLQNVEKENEHFKLEKEEQIENQTTMKIKLAAKEIEISDLKKRFEKLQSIQNTKTEEEKEENTFRKLNHFKNEMDSKLILLKKDNMISFLESQIKEFQISLQQQEKEQKSPRFMTIEQKNWNLIETSQLEFEKSAKKLRMENLEKELAQIEETMKIDDHAHMKNFDFEFFFSQNKNSKTKLQQIFYKK
jgi:hypothetical protein